MEPRQSSPLHRDDDDPTRDDVGELTELESGDQSLGEDDAMQGVPFTD
jgi:hypothetical protein